MTRIEYKGYIGEVTIDEESEWLCANTIGMQGGATAEAETFAQLKEEFATSIEDYLAVCAERGITPERSFSGHFQDNSSSTNAEQRQALEEPER